MPLCLAIVATHPIQYQAPWFRALAARPEVDLTVFYGMIPNAYQQGVGFGVEFRWDIPLLAGYRYRVLKNRSSQPALGTFGGSDTPDIRRELGGFDAVIVNGWGSKTCLQTLLATRRLGIPCLVRGESNALKPRPSWVRLVHRLLLRQYAAFLFIGEANRKFYERNGIDSGKLFPALYCIDNDAFGKESRRLRPARAKLRQGWGIPPEAWVALYCGKLIEKKRPLDLLAALAEVPSQRRAAQRLHVLFAGDGALRSVCESLAREHSLPVAFAGFLNQTEILGAYVAADCLVLPSDHGETWGLVVNEAMACGLPAILSDRVGCHPDLLLPGYTGLLVPFGDVSALADAIVALCSDPNRTAAMGEQARQHIQGYSIEALVAGTLDAVHYVLKRKPGRCPLGQVGA